MVQEGCLQDLGDCQGSFDDAEGDAGMDDPALGYGPHLKLPEVHGPQPLEEGRLEDAATG